MAIRFEIRQQVRTVRRSWLEVVAEPTSERVARAAFRRCCQENPGAYFELVAVEVTERCLGYTKDGVPTES